MTPLPRLRQVALVARDLEATVASLRQEFGLGEPYRDPAVAYFGLVNAVFPIGDTFLEVVSPVSAEEAGARTAARQLERSGAEVTGYMAMLQVDALAPARERAKGAGVREVFTVELNDIAEVHLHPGDMRGAIVSLSQPVPAETWRWGGEGWRTRAVPGSIRGITVAVADPIEVAVRWEHVAGGVLPGCRFVTDEGSPGVVAVELQVGGEARTLSLA